MKKNKKIKILILCILICFSMITITICISNNIKKKIFLKDINSNISNKNFKSFRISEEDYCINDKNYYINLKTLSKNFNICIYNKGFKINYENNKLVYNKENNRFEINNRIEKLKNPILYKDNIPFMSTNDINKYLDLDYESTSMIFRNTYASKTLIVKSDNENIIKKTKPSDIISYKNINVLYYNNIENTKKAYNILQNNKKTIDYVNIDSIIKPSINEEILSDSCETINTSKENTELLNYILKNKTSRKVVVAVIDSGIKYDLDIFKDRIMSKDINYSSSKGDVYDELGHGTMVSSLIVGRTNNNVKILPIKVINNEGCGSTLSIYLAIQKAIEEKVDIINISLNAKYNEEADLITDAIKEAYKKGIKVVVSAGNHNSNVEAYSPANIKEAIVVAATDDAKNKTNYSNYGNLVDYCAFGIDETVIDISDQKIAHEGTSFSAAIVTSVLANLYYTSKNIDDFTSKTDEIGNYIGYYIPTKSKEKNVSQKNILDYMSNWKDISINKIEEAFDNSNLEQQAVFWQSLNKKEKSLLRSKTKILDNKITQPNKEEKDDTYIDAYGTKIDIYEYSDYKTYKIYEYLENYKINTNYEISAADDITLHKQGHFYISFEQYLKNSSGTKPKSSTTSPFWGNAKATIYTTLSSTNIKDYDKDKLKASFSYKIDSSGTNKANFNITKGSGNHKLGTSVNNVAEKESWYNIMYLEYDYTKPAHTDIVGGGVTNRCSVSPIPCRAKAGTYNKDNNKAEDNYKNGFTHTSTSDGGKIHSITINMCNTGNLTRKGHGGEKHAIFHIKIVYTSSILKVNLNEKMTGDDKCSYNCINKYGHTCGWIGSSVVNWGDKESIENTCNFKSGLLQDSPSRLGYKFKGWFIGGENVGTPSLYNIGCQKTTTAKAGWERRHYSVTYDANGGTFDSDGSSAWVDMATTNAYGDESGGQLFDTLMQGMENRIPKKTSKIYLKDNYTYNGYYDKTLSVDSIFKGFYYKWKTDWTDKITGAQPIGIETQTHTSDGIPKVHWRIPQDGTVYAKWESSSAILPSLSGRTGYNFIGWSKSPSATSPSYYAGKSYELSDGETLYAVWSPITYTVRLHSNLSDAYGYITDGWTRLSAATECVLYKTFTYNSTTLPTPSSRFHAYGYDIGDYWYTESGCSYNNRVSPGIKNLTTTQDDIIDLYADWSLITNTIRLHPNQPPEASNNVERKTLSGWTWTGSYYEKSCTPAYESLPSPSSTYSLKYWNIKSDWYSSGGTNYGTQVPSQYGIIDLYAEWTPQTYTVNLHANFDDNMSKKNNVITPNGQDGWVYNKNTEILSKTFKYDIDKLISPDEAFKVEGWHISDYWMNEAIKTDITELTYVYGDDRDKNLTNIPNKILDFYAEWEANRYTVVLHDNITKNASHELEHFESEDWEWNAEDKTFTKEFIYDTTPMCSPESKYALHGWTIKDYWTDNPNENNSTVKIKEGNKCVSGIHGGTTHLYAQWTPVKYIVRLHANLNPKMTNAVIPTTTNGWTWNANTNILTKEFTYDDDYLTAPDTMFKVDGWKLHDKWLLSPTLDENTEFQDTPVRNLTEVDGTEFDFYAYWFPIKYTVILHPNQHEDASHDVQTTVDNGWTEDEDGNLVKEFIYDETPIDKPSDKFELEGWEIGDYWIDKPIEDDDTKRVPAGDKKITTIDGDIVHLYPKWTPITYTVILHANLDNRMTNELTHNNETGWAWNETEKTLTKTFQYDLTRLDTPTSKFSVVGWTPYKDWMDTETYIDGLTKYYEPGTRNLLSTKGATIHLFAKWNPNKYNVILYPNLDEKASHEVQYVEDNGWSWNGSELIKEFIYDVTPIDSPSSRYSLEGWSIADYWMDTPIDSDGTRHITTGNKKLTSINGDTVKLYAKWSPHTYKVILHPNTDDRMTSELIHFEGNGWTWNGNFFYKDFIYDDTILDNPNSKYSVVGWALQDYWSSTPIETALSKRYYAGSKNLTAEDGEILDLYGIWREIIYTVVFHKSRDEAIRNQIDGPDEFSQTLKYEDTIDIPIGTEIYTPKEDSDLIFRYFEWEGKGTKFYQNIDKIHKLTTTDGEVIHMVAQWLPFKIEADYYSITDRDRGQDIIFTEYVFGQLEIKSEEEVEKIKVQLPPPDSDFNNNYMEFVTKYDPEKYEYETTSNLTKIFEYEPNKDGVFDKYSFSSNMFYVKYNEKPFVKKTILVSAYRDKRWIKTVPLTIMFENKDRVPMSRKIKTRIRFDSWLED